MFSSVCMSLTLVVHSPRIPERQDWSISCRLLSPSPFPTTLVFVLDMDTVFYSVQACISPLRHGIGNAHEVSP